MEKFILRLNLTITRDVIIGDHLPSLDRALRSKIFMRRMIKDLIPTLTIVIVFS